ncbi:cytochrome c [Bosea sp. 117]|uniref:c-type cytochrome n=1 Tax=Bosea sp. 117 TaxID=1125973 RepID=UPI0006914433|nr:cytochrome c [Bosea sp. 117]
MRLALVFLVPALWLATAPADAAPPRGATSCTGCHPRTASRGPVPTLNGRPAAEIAEQMTAFKTGERPSTVMTRIAKGFSEDEIRALAEWFAANAAPGAKPSTAPANAPAAAQP